MNMLERVFFFAAALLLIKPGWITDLIGISIGAVVGARQISRYRGLRGRVREGEVSPSESAGNGGG
jgi:TRAP-type uncharacterized transport system fused permease subunit